MMKRHRKELGEMVIRKHFSLDVQLKTHFLLLIFSSEKGFQKLRKGFYKAYKYKYRASVRTPKTFYGNQKLFYLVNFFLIKNSVHTKIIFITIKHIKIYLQYTVISDTCQNLLNDSSFFHFFFIHITSPIFLDVRSEFIQIDYVSWQMKSP